MFKTLSVIIPVYNEHATLREVLHKVLNVDLQCIDTEVICIDDGSRDGSQHILTEVAGLYPGKVKLAIHKRNLGKGAAIRTGIQLLEGDYVIIQDADLEYDPDDYSSLLKLLIDENADVVYGSRFLGDAHNFGIMHRIGNQFLTWMTNLLFGTKLTDMETCYKLFRRDVIEHLELSSNRFDIEPEITAKVLKGNLRIVEVPISYNGRNHEAGKKISIWRDGLPALWALIRFRFLN